MGFRTFSTQRVVPQTRGGVERRVWSSGGRPFSQRTCLPAPLSVLWTPWSAARQGFRFEVHWLIGSYIHSFIDSASIIKHPEFHKRKSFRIIFARFCLSEWGVGLPGWGQPMFCAIFTLVPYFVKSTFIEQTQRQDSAKPTPSQLPLLLVFPGGSLWPGSHTWASFSDIRRCRFGQKRGPRNQSRSGSGDAQGRAGQAKACSPFRDNTT